MMVSELSIARWRAKIVEINALPVGTGAARALPFGKDTRNLQINPSAALIQINRWLPKALSPPPTPPGLTPY